jgi:hypothetical protein
MIIIKLRYRYDFRHEISGTVFWYHVNQVVNGSRRSNNPMTLLCCIKLPGPHIHPSRHPYPIPALLIIQYKQYCNIKPKLNPDKFISITCNELIDEFCSSFRKQIQPLSQLLQDFTVYLYYQLKKRFMADSNNIEVQQPPLGLHQKEI